MKVAIMFPLVVVLGLFAACEDPGKKVYSSDAERLLGSWSWIRTSGGIAGVNETPANTGRTGGVIFTATELICRENGSESMSSVYHLGRAMTIFNTDSIPVVYAGTELIFGYAFSGNDTLALWDNFVDGFFFSYCRE